MSALVSPLSVPIVYMSAGFILWGDPDSSLGQIVTSMENALPYVAVIGYAISALLGGPLIVVLLAAKRLTFWWCTSLAAVLDGAGAFAFGCVFPGPDGDNAGNIDFLLTGAAVTSIVAGIFCVLGGVPFRRAQQSAPSGSKMD